LGIYPLKVEWIGYLQFLIGINHFKVKCVWNENEMYCV